MGVSAAFFGGPLADQVRDISRLEGTYYAPVPLGIPYEDLTTDDPCVFAYKPGDWLPSGEMAYYPAAAGGS